jgi:hypothetical protein
MKLAAQLTVLKGSIVDEEDTIEGFITNRHSQELSEIKKDLKDLMAYIIYILNIICIEKQYTEISENENGIEIYSTPRLEFVVDYSGAELLMLNFDDIQFWKNRPVERLAVLYAGWLKAFRSMYFHNPTQYESFQTSFSREVDRIQDKYNDSVLEIDGPVPAYMFLSYCWNITVDVYEALLRNRNLLN